MKINKRRAMNNIGIAMLLLSIAVSFKVGNSYPVLIMSFPLMIINRAFVIPFLFAVETIKGAVSLDDGISPAEAFSVVMVCLILPFDLLKNHETGVPFKLSKYYILFPVLAILGFYVWILHPQIFSASHNTLLGTYFKFSAKLLLLFFCFFLLKTYINFNKNLLLETLDILSIVIPYLIFLVALYLFTFGQVSGQFSVAHFGDAHHGEFTADLCALGAYMYIMLFDPKRNLYHKILVLLAFVALLLIVLKMASRNGIICFGLSGMLCLYTLFKKKSTFKKFAFIMVAGLIGIGILFFAQNSPTIQRFIFKTEVEGGGDRLDYWYSGIQAFFKEPLFGLGGDESSSIYAVSIYEPGVEPHVMHNTFLEMAVEYGLLGFIFYMAMFFTILGCAYRNFLYAIETDQYILAVPSISYSVVMFSALFISRVWQLTIWYHLTLVLVIYLVWVYPREKKAKLTAAMPRIKRQLA